MHIEKEDLYNERINIKLKLRRSKINNILLSKRIKSEVENHIKIELENKNKNKTTENIRIPTDFQFKIHKYYDNVLFF